MIKIDISKKVILVSAGSRGIGEAISTIFSENETNTVIIFGRNRKNYLSSKLSKKKNVFFYEFDATNLLNFENFINYLISNFPKIDILVNNVGGGGRWGSENFEETPDFTWEEVINKNLKIAYLLTQRFLPNMIKKKWGRVVTISSIYGKEAGGRPWFNVSKSAQISLMKSYSKSSRLSSKNITFNTVCPGAIETNNSAWKILKKNKSKDYEKTILNIPRLKMGKPMDIASYVYFLCSEYGKHINGSCITIDGGESNSF